MRSRFTLVLVALALLLAVAAAAQASSVLLVGERSPSLEDMLVRAGFSVCTGGCGHYDVVIVNNDADIDVWSLRQFIASGGGVALLGGAPYYLAGGQDLSPISDWLGARRYTNAPRCVYATASVDHPFGCCLGAGDTIAQSACSWGGASAVASVTSATVVAWWSSGSVFAMTNTYGWGRVYYQSQLGYGGPCALRLFVDAVRWLAHSP